MMVVVTGRGHLVDRTTQAWVRATGRRVCLNDHPWLQGPSGDTDVVADAWLEREAQRLRGTVRDGGGLLEMSALDGPTFDARRLRPEIADFYERTSEWRLDVWSQWCAAMWPFGWMLSSLFSRRLRQLSLPLRPLDVAHGMTSTVKAVVARNGDQMGAMWLRTLRSTGQTVYSGWYGAALLPGSSQPSVRVVFPLPNGSVTVMLRPSVDSAGALTLTSPDGRFGDEGAYLLVAEPNGRTAWVRRAPLVERFRVYVDDESTLRTDHALDLWSVPVIRLHYRLQREQAVP